MFGDFLSFLKPGYQYKMTRESDMLPGDLPDDILI